MLYSNFIDIEGRPKKDSKSTKRTDFFVRDGIHSDADYNSTWVGVVIVVVVVVAIFTMG